jgi:methionine synthase II (cobalamin-independent)
MTFAASTWKGLPSFSGTGIGSVPFLSAPQACDEILRHDRLIPFWPQLVAVSVREDMLFQFSPPLPCLKPDWEEKVLAVDPDCRRPEALLHFYEKFLGADPDYFSLRPDYASGFYALLEAARKRPAPFLKGQIVGPVTLGLSVRLAGSRFLIHEPELMDAVVKGLAAQALNQAFKFRDAGRKALIFIDEPSLSGYGSAFTPLARNEVLALLGELIGLIREKAEVLVGLHCCGNTDWSLLLALDLDIINLDAYDYGEAFTLYPREIRDYLEQDRAVAWGIVPTTAFSGNETPEFLLAKLGGYFETLVRQGLDRERLLRQALLTPACGLGTLPEKTAETLLDLLNRTCRRAPEYFGAPEKKEIP